MLKTQEIVASDKESEKVYLINAHFITQYAIGLKEEICRDIYTNTQLRTIVMDATSVTEADIISINSLVQIHLSAAEKGCRMELRLHRGTELDHLLQATRFHEQLNLVYS